jgi:nucleoside 2-deoxyribosyltransferase
MQVYVASPLGFSEAGNVFYRDTLIPLLQRLGHDVVDPWTLTDRQKLDAVSAMPYGPERRDAWRRLNAEIARTNHAAIDHCDALVAVLDGADVDSGTAAEIGYAFARGKPIIGYRGDVRLSADNEGAVVNLQVEYFIHESGGCIVRSLAELSDAFAAIKAPQRGG